MVVVDQRAIAEALSVALVDAGLSCAAVADRTADALEALDAHTPDAVVVGLPLIDADALELARRLAAHGVGTTITLFAGVAEHRMIERATDAGVHAIVAKWSPLEVLLDTLREPRSGTPWIDPAFDRRSRLAASEPGLTPREHDVLRLLGDGLAPQQIAQTLGITVNTTRGHVKALLAKLEAHSVLQAVLTAQRRGLL